MDENTNLNVDTGVDQNTDTATGNDNVNNDTTENVSMSKADFDKAIQSAEDKVRSKLSKEIKDLQAQLPVKKTDAEVVLENRLAEIEAKQLEVETKEKDLALRAALQEANLDKSIADFVKTDVDVNALCAAIDKVVNAKIAAQGYVPSNGNANNTGITQEQFNKMDYTDMEKIYKTNPNLIKKFIGK